MPIKHEFWSWLRRYMKYGFIWTCWRVHEKLWKLDLLHLQGTFLLEYIVLKLKPNPKNHLWPSNTTSKPLVPSDTAADLTLNNACLNCSWHHWDQCWLVHTAPSRSLCPIWTHMWWQDSRQDMQLKQSHLHEPSWKDVESVLPPTEQTGFGLRTRVSRSIISAACVSNVVVDGQTLNISSSVGARLRLAEVYRSI